MSNPQTPLLIATGTEGDYYPVNSDHPIPANISSVVAPIAIRHGQASVGTTPTVQLTSGALTQGVTVKSKVTNTGKIYVGITGVSTSTGYPLSPGDSVFIACDNANRVFVISDTSSQSVAWIGS